MDIQLIFAGSQGRRRLGLGWGVVFVLGCLMYSSMAHREPYVFHTHSASTTDAGSPRTDIPGRGCTIAPVAPVASGTPGVVQWDEPGTAPRPAPVPVPEGHSRNLAGRHDPVISNERRTAGEQ